MPRPLWGAKLPKRFSFDLPDPFARNVELLADLFERVLALAADAEPEADDLLFFGREGLEDVSRFVTDVGVDDGVHGRADPAVFDEIAEGRFAVAADRGFERHRVARDGLQLLDLLNRNVHAAADFVIGGSAAEFLLELTGSAEELVHALVHVHRNADGAGLVGDGARNGLTNPPCGVGRELVAAAVFELVGGAPQADVAFLNQLEQMQAAV